MSQKPLHIHHREGQPPAVTRESLKEWLELYRMTAYVHAKEEKASVVRERFCGSNDAVKDLSTALGIELPPMDFDLLVTPPHSSVPAKPGAAAYAPAPELVAAAETSVASASPEALATAERLYAAYGAVTSGRSAVTGATLPTFSACSMLVRAGWLAVAQDSAS